VTVSSRRMLRPELLARKAELEKALDVLLKYDVDSVSTELGEISYLLREPSADT
jgi:hypothetical protein